MAALILSLKRYSIPLLLLSLAIFWQLFVLPVAFPPSHYDVLGVRRFGSIEEVNEAFENLSAKWKSSEEVPKINDFVKVRYAFELLSNPVWKRDYDIFGIDEQLDVIEKVKERYNGESFSAIDLPLLDSSSFDSFEHAFSGLTAEGFRYTLGDTGTWLIQICSFGSTRCAQFSSSWKRIASLLEGVAGTGMVDLGEVQLATYLAERLPTGQPYFRDGLPSFVAFPYSCRSLDCLLRYQGDLSVDAVADWIATTILGLPRILYYSKETLVHDFILKDHHKVKVIFFSKTGERVAPFLRQAARDYWAHASFASVLWREVDSSIWWNMFEVESAPAIIFLRDPGVKPIVHHGIFNSSWFLNTMELNKHQELPQIRSITSMELGCDARGYSRAGNDTMTWYCVILAGRMSLELNKLRETMRRVQDTLLNGIRSDLDVNDGFSAEPLAATALTEQRLTFGWLDGEAQQKYCFFYLYSEDSYDTCGPRRYGDPTDVPRLFIVRYKRNSTEDHTEVQKRPRTIWDTDQEEGNLASQLVARYNGSMDSLEIIKWISQIIKDGESRDLPFFRMKTPELVPEAADPIWLKGAHGILSRSKGVKLRIQRIPTYVYDLFRDPRVGPILLLGALMSFGGIWLQANQLTRQNKMVKERSPMGNHKATTSDRDQPTSITDTEPKDAYQMLNTDSDSD